MGLNKNVDIEISVQDDCFAKNWMKNKNIQNLEIGSILAP
jgi:hypothetical protein